MSDQYTVIFKGEIISGENLEQVKERLKSSLKTDDKGVSKLFSGNPVVVRQNTDLVTAEKYKKVFAAAGAACEIRKEDPTGNQSAAKPPASEVKVHFIKTSDGGKMIISNIETIPGKNIVEHFGLVSGSTIRAKHIGRDFMASLKNLVGGELKGYTQLLQESRQQAMDRMIKEARLMGANAIVNVRFSTSSVAQGAAELYAYGTAVRVE